MVIACLRQAAGLGASFIHQEAPACIAHLHRSRLPAIRRLLGRRSQALKFSSPAGWAQGALRRGDRDLLWRGDTEPLPSHIWGFPFDNWEEIMAAATSSTVCQAQPASAAEVGLSEQTAAIIDGKAIAQKVREELAVEVAELKKKTGEVPGLAVVLVGSRKDSETYVRGKRKACLEVGIESFGADLPETATEEEVLRIVEDLNRDPRIHGVLVQLPLPSHISEERILSAIGPDKDVDGFHPINLGTLAMQKRDPAFVACTPKGCIELLVRSGVEIKGKQAVVVGRSAIVGMPAALLLQRRDATVTVVHSRTPNPAELTRQADIVIAAAGRPELVRGNWIKPGAAVIDVGINAVDDPSAKRGYRLVGDVCFEEVSRVASKITPVPGGVGPMTIAMLLENTVISAKRQLLG